MIGKYFLVCVLALAVTASLACRDSVPTPTQTPAPELTAAPTATLALTPMASPVPTIAPTPTQPPTPAPELTAVPTATPTSIPMPSPTPTATPTSTPIPAPEPTPTIPSTPMQTPTPTPAGERIDWTRCESSDLECGFVEVPADYRDPETGSIRIAVNVHRATSPDNRIGYLFVNPGGPGGSGVEFVHGIPYGQFTDEIVAHFDIVGFDPRGVGESEPAFACGDPGEQLALLATIDGAIDTPAEIAAGEAAADLCIQSMGPVAGLLHSEYVARDMEEIRKALGADQISYLGFSYGSVLGVWYATLFPESVRAMVVDGADNPVDQAATQQERIDEAIEEVAPLAAFLEKALTACAGPECPIYNDGDPVGYFKQAAAKLGLVNAAANDNPAAGFLGVLSALYTEEDWPRLRQGLFELNENDDPSILLDIARKNLGPEPGAVSFAGHVNCLDKWVLHPEVDRATQLDDELPFYGILEEMLPLLAVIFPRLADACLFYDQFAPEPLEGPLDGGGVPILVIGNRSDPITPFGESEELVTETLSNGYLLETSHFEHIVYPANDCVNDHVHGALIDGVYPGERRLFCEEATTTPVSTTKIAPTPPSGTFVSVSSVLSHTCGVRTDGSVTCWGQDLFGEATPPSGEFSSVSAGGFHTCGVRTGGAVACWGDIVGQDTLPSGEFSSVSAGLGYTCGVRTDGAVACWGDDLFGQATPPSGEFSSVSAGIGHTCGVRTGGAVVCWGYNEDAEGNVSGQATPPSGEFSSVSAGLSHTCGVRTGGAVACWGSNVNAEGNVSGQATPPSGEFSSVSAGWFHTCGVRSGGAVACWGDIVGQAAPPSGEFSSVSAGQSHTCGVRTDGAVACWGDD